jgi:hypothetical protein
MKAREIAATDIPSIMTLPIYPTNVPSTIFSEYAPQEFLGAVRRWVSAQLTNLISSTSPEAPD